VRLVSSENHVQSSPPIGWLRYLLPSVTDLLFIILLASMTIGAFAPRMLGDAGIGWHIRNGELMLRTHTITRTDFFSSTMAGRPWYAWEWLYDVKIALVHHCWGLNGVVFATALGIALTFALLFSWMRSRGTDLFVTVGLVVLAISASSIHMFARPHIVSWFLTLIWFQLLDQAEINRNRRYLYWLPMITIAWVNLHGGFLVGLILVAIYLVAALIHYRENRDWSKSLVSVFVMTLLATLVNPYGYKLHVHVYEYLSNRFLMDHIDEFASPNFHGVAQRCFLGLLLIAVTALAARREKIRASTLLVMLFAAYSGLYASRNLPVSSILLAITAGPVLSAAMKSAGGVFSKASSFSQRMGRVESTSRGHLWPAIAVLLGLVICSGQGNLGGRQFMSAHFDEKRFPAQAASVLEQMGLPRQVFAPDYWGGYLIYRFYPRMRVVLDDRHDLYGEAFLRDYLTTIHVTPGWEKMLDEKHVEWALLPEKSSLANMLKVSGWKVYYEDETGVLLQKP
jgi:hypothetical protein